jgi:hypothetical protein
MSRSGNELGDFRERQFHLNILLTQAPWRRHFAGCPEGRLALGAGERDLLEAFEGILLSAPQRGRSLDGRRDGGAT